MKKLFVILAILLVGLASCDEGTQPEEPEIVEVKADKIELNSKFKNSFPLDTNFIIHNQEELNQIVTDPPKIDFSKFTLLGSKFFIGSRCPFPPIYIKVLKNTRAKTYEFLLEYDDRGICAASWQHTFWYLIPKIESNATVKFERREIGNKYRYDTTLVEENTKIWASNIEYGAAKTIFKKGEPLYVHYSFKNYTEKPLDWFQDVDGEFCNIQVSGTNQSFFFPEDRINRDTLTWGILKEDETVASSWKVENPPLGEYRIIGEPIRDFKLIRFPFREVKITIEE